MQAKRILLLMLLIICGVLLLGCAQKQAAVPIATAEPAVQTTPVHTPVPTPAPKPVYGDMLRDGSYDIEVDSSSSMFRPVKAVLTVEEGSMQVCMTMGGQGYGFLYMGTGEEAIQDSEDIYISFVMDEEGAKTFTVPVEALNVETDCAAWSIRKEKWYDRILVFMSDMLPAEAYIAE